MAGRKSKATDPRQELVLKALHAGATLNAAAGYAKVDRRTLWRWMSKYATFRDAVEQSQDEAENRFSAVVMKEAVAGDWKAAAFWLERRRHEDWGKRETIKHTGTGEDEAVLVESKTGKAELTLMQELAESNRRMAKALEILERQRDGHSEGPTP